MASVGVCRLLKSPSMLQLQTQTGNCLWRHRHPQSLCPGSLRRWDGLFHIANIGISSTKCWRPPCLHQSAQVWELRFRSVLHFPLPQVCTLKPESPSLPMAFGSEGGVKAGLGRAFFKRLPPNVVPEQKLVIPGNESQEEGVSSKKENKDKWP